MSRSSLASPSLRVLPALPVTLAFASGIVAAMLLPSTLPRLYIIPGVCAIAIVALLFAPTRRAALLALIASAGAADMTLADLHSPVPDGEHLFTGKITALYTGSSEAFGLRLTSADSTALKDPPEVIAVLSGEPPADILPGYTITFRGSFTPPDTADRHIMPSYGQRFAASAFITPRDIVGLAPAPGLRAAAERLRNRLRAILLASQLTPEAKEFLATALLGERATISASTREAFSRAGLAHILALSGLHLAIIAGLFYWVLAPLVLVAPRHVRSIALLILIWAYALLTGLGAPVVRAALMTSIVLLADLLQRRSVSLNSLFAAALIILIPDPALIADAGFQLTFLAVGAIITLSDSLNPFAASRRRWLVKLGESIGVSAAAMLATGLIAALRFHSIPLLFLPANIILTPVVVPLLLGAGLLLLGALTLGLPCGMLIAAVDELVRLLNAVAESIAAIPYSSISTYGLSTMTAVIAIAGVVSAAIALYGPSPSRRALAVTAVISLCAIISAAVTSGTEPPLAPGEWIAMGKMRHQAILIPSGSDLYLVTDAPPTIAGNLRDRLDTDLTDFMGRHSMRRLILMPDTLTTPAVIRRGRHIFFHGKYLRIVDRPAPAPLPSLPRPDILVVAAGFRGSPDNVTDSIRPLKVIVSAGLNSSVRSRLTDSLAARAIPFVTK